MFRGISGWCWRGRREEGGCVFLGNPRETDVSHRFTMSMALFLQIWTGRRGKWKEATFSTPVTSTDTWCGAKVKGDGQRGSNDLSRVCWLSFVNGGEGWEGKWNPTQQRNRSFDHCGSFKVSFSNDGRWIYLIKGLKKKQDQEKQDVNKEANKTK